MDEIEQEMLDIVLEHAEILASRMSLDEVNRAKAAAEEHTGPPTAWGDTIAEDLSCATEQEAGAPGCEVIGSRRGA